MGSGRGDALNGGVGAPASEGTACMLADTQGLVACCTLFSSAACFYEEGDSHML